MMKSKPRFLTYSNTVATTALVLAFAGGGTAALAAGSLVKNEVKSRHIAAGAVHTSDLANGAVNGSKIAAGTIGASDLRASSVGADELVDKAVNSEHIADKAIGASQIADDAVTGAAVNEASLGEVPSAKTASSVKGMFVVSVDTDGKIVRASGPTGSKSPAIADGPSGDARILTFDGVDARQCSLSASVASNKTGQAGQVFSPIAAWPTPVGGVVVETHPSFNPLDPHGDLKAFTLMVMC
jgi:hypothetical protein